MASAAPGKRIWKCPECGSEVELSVTQLDPIACDSCLAKMRKGSSSAPSLGSAVEAPMGLWQGLPETTKLAVVVAALIIGGLIGYFVGLSHGSSKAPVTPKHTTKPVTESHSTSNPEQAPDEDEPKSTEQPELRPPQPGPDYHWVRGRLRKDGTRGDGHWAKNPNGKSGSSDSSK